MQALTEWLINIVHHLGYFGIFLATLVESTFVPIPSEVTMIPAGMLVARGEMNYWLALFSATAGVVAGSLLNYWLGIKFGRALVLRYGKYVGLKPHALHKTEYFFYRYGAIAAFIGRLLPGVRHYIAFIAGIAQMKLRTFIIYSGVGGLIWIWILLQMGYMAGLKAAAGESDAHEIEIIIIACVLISLIAYIVQRWLMRHHHHEEKQENPPSGDKTDE